MIRGPSRPLSPLSTQSSPGRVLGAKQCSFTARSRTKSRGAARRGRRAWWYATAQGLDPRRRADVERWTGHRAGARTSLPHARPPVITASLVLRRRINYRRWWKGAALFRVSGHPRASWRGLVESVSRKAALVSSVGSGNHGTREKRRRTRRWSEFLVSSRAWNPNDRNLGLSNVVNVARWWFATSPQRTWLEGRNVGRSFLSLFLSFLFLFLFLPSLLSIDPFRFNFAGRQPADATSAHLPAGRWCTIRCTGSDAWNLGENRASVNCFFDPWNGLQSNRGVTFFFVCFFLPFFESWLAGDWREWGMGWRWSVVSKIFNRLEIFGDREFENLDWKWVISLNLRYCEM